MPQAIETYQRALHQNPANTDIKEKLTIAESKRQISVSKCLRLRGSSGLAACNEGLLPGAKDESTIRARQGDLLVQMGEQRKALKAYRSAQKLDPRNPHIRESLAALTTPSKPAPAREPVREAGAAGASEPNSREASQGKTETANWPEKEQMVSEKAYSNAPLVPGVTF